MNKKIVVIPVLITVIGLVLVFSSNDGKRPDDTVFHITLADPKMYESGVFTDKFSIESGMYSFRFVPNGDSPQILSISLRGDDFDFDEDFRLKGTLHETGISEYYTWDYQGQKKIEFLTSQDIDIKINPNGNLVGTVSVDIIEN